MKKLIPLFLLTIFTFFIFVTPVMAFDKTESGIISNENLPEITDEEFLKAPVRIEIFVKSWCKYCKELEKSTISTIYSKYTKNEVAIRILDGEHPEVEKYYKNYTDLFDMPENMKDRVPTTIINGEYLMIGYGGKEMDEAMLKGIDQLLKGNSLDVFKTFTLKEEHKNKNNKLIYQYQGNAKDYLKQEENKKITTNKPEENKITEIESKKDNNSNKTENASKEEQVKTSPLADNITFFAVQGIYDSINNPIFAYILAVLLFFIPYDKKKSLIFSGLYILGMVGANIVVRFYNTGLYSYRQPILITLSLLFAYFSLSIFWDILFTTYNKGNKEKIKYNRSLILRILEKILNNKLSYILVFIFAFAIYFFTTPFDLDYGVILYYDERFSVALKALLIIINGLCASVLTVFLGFVVQMAKKMVHELIEPLKKYSFFYCGIIFYATLTFLLVYNILKTY